MNQTDTALRAVFEMEPLAETPNPPVANTTIPDYVVPLAVAPEKEERTVAEQKAEEDFEFSRGALKTLAVEAQTTLHRAVEAAEQTDKASSFTAVAELLRATVETHKQLHDLHKTSAEVRIAAQAGRTPQAQVNIQQGVVFNGTSEELLRLIDKSRQ
jgi:hypothetical protein